MNGVHDMGGMHGYGRVVVENDEPVFHARWEATARTTFERTSGRFFNLDEFRRAMEQMPPASYLGSSYYEKWLYALESILKEKGVITTDELATGRASFPLPSPAPTSNPLPSQPPRYKIGDAVVTRNLNPEGHTRLPRYARGKRGLIQRYHGSYLLPDANAHGNGANWQPCYAVGFDARELWGPEGKARDRVCIDLWESYLDQDVPA